MNKSAFFAIVGAALLASVALNAQSSFKFGPKAGLNVSKFSGDISSAVKSKTGFLIGVFGEYMFTKKLGVQGELLYSGQGATQKVSAVSNGKYFFNYLNIPVTARYYFWEGAHVFSGPQVSFLLSAKTNVNGTKKPINDEAEKMDISWTIGAGYELKQGIVADIRFNQGLMDIASAKSKNNKNSVFQVSICYKLDKLK